MRVDSFVSSASTELMSVSTKQEESPSSVSTASRAPQDHATLLSGSDSIASLTQQAIQSGGVERAEKVQSLQHAVSSGEYKPDASKIAEAMTTATY